MTREAFLDNLRRGLRGLPDQEISDILADYSSYFKEADAAGRDAEDVAKALGDPRRLARELKAEMGLLRWERNRTPANLFVVILALGGLATVDIFVLLPLLFGVGLIALVSCFVLLLLGVIGIGNLLSLTPFGQGPSGEQAPSSLLSGIGLVASSAGGGVLLMLLLNAGMKLLARYVRLHYRLFKPAHGDMHETNNGA